MSKPDMYSHWTNYWLFNYVGFDRRLKSYQPVKPTWKNWTYVKNIRNELKPPFLDEPDIVYHLTEYDRLFEYNQMVFDRGKIRPGGKIHFKKAY